MAIRAYARSIETAMAQSLLDWRPMRWTVAAGLVLTLSGSACFEDSSPVETGETASSGAECIDGTEGCPCIEGACVGELTCLSNTCVDAGATSNPTTGATTNMTISTSSEDVMDDGSVEVGPSGPPMTTNDSGTEPGDACDPIYQPCDFDLHCVLTPDQFFICDYPGPVGPSDGCSDLECGPQLVCIQSEAFFECLDGSFGCCTTWCDLFGEESFCPDDQICLPPYGLSQPPIPGFEHVGVCVQNRF